MTRGKRAQDRDAANLSALRAINAVEAFIRA
jgi:hypothetical protein